MEAITPPSLKNAIAILATMHGKEQVIAPILEQGLGLKVELATGIDTDRFGTFSHDIERTGSQLDAAKAKIASGFAHFSNARVGIASEGSFGPHPFIPFVPVAREIVLLVDRESGLEIVGHDVSLDTNFSHKVVTDVASALAFAEAVKFPEHGLVVLGAQDDKPAPALALFKKIDDAAELEAAVSKVIGICGTAFVETDMRAHRNPTRMTAIGRAASDLVRRYNSLCPVCQWPGYDVTERIKGLPCSLCGEPTEVIRAEVLSCRKCTHREERTVAGRNQADPGQCAQCNP